ncbi:MAG: hypothetical protein NWQ45_04885 [Congregibacter sp.]|nr:hypothetical protein [Congregibacter sp.]
MRRPRSRHTDPAWSITSAAAALTVIVMSAINVALMDTGLGNSVEFLLGLLLGAVGLLLASVFVGSVTAALGAIPIAAVSVIGGAVLTVWTLRENAPATIARLMLDEQPWTLGGLPELFDYDLLSPAALAGLLLTVALIAGLLTLVIKNYFADLKTLRKLQFGVLAAVLITTSLITLLRLVDDGTDPYPLDGAHPQAMAVDNPLLDAAQNPAAPGSYAFSTLTYGAGDNPRRPEFGSARDLESRTVDARRLLPQWKDFKQTMREGYWGFGLDKAPLNGRIWMPTGVGPFPLVLIVHGNHGMEDYSDDGYAYLGELLASRGFITVSVDQNYINGSWSGDFQGKEMAARGWLLLEHLALWRDWNQTVGHRFQSRVDLNNIALLGHSRGGEAVSIAHSFNELSHFPDDATVAFDYGFNIRALVAIAQVDQRYHRRLELNDVDFFTIHGSYDSDEPAYHGLRQMNRISYTDGHTDDNSDDNSDDYFFKAGVYVHGANHGQFNTGWGRYDYSPPGAWGLNTAPMIAGGDQRTAAKVYIAAFLEASLHRDRQFLSLLKDPRRLAPWLPPTSYVHQFSDSSFTAFADFEEDIDASTASQAAAAITAQNLSVWREEALAHRDKRLQGSNAVVLGWQGSHASYTVQTTDAQFITADRSLVFAVSGSTENLPKLPGADADSQAGSQAQTKAQTKADPSTPPTIADFSVVLTTDDSQTARLQVSGYAQLIPPVRVQYLKSKKQNKEEYNSDWEPVLQYVEIPFSAFLSVNPQLALSKVTAIRFEFDQAARGILILDNIGSAQSGVR